LVIRVYRILVVSIRASSSSNGIRPHSVRLGIVHSTTNSDTHRSRLVKEYVEGLNGRIALEHLPPYAPESNPVEHIWGYLKHHVMPNYCARDLTDLRQRASRNLRSMQRRGTLVTAFWKQAELL
jgi:transposase